MIFLGKVIEAIMDIIAPIIVCLFYGVILICVLIMFLAIFLLPPAYILRLPQWISSHSDSCIKIKYSTFISMYNIKPYAWGLEDDTVFYKRKINDDGWYHELKTHFCFGSYIDYCHYRRFLNRVRKKKDLEETKFMEERNCEELRKVLDHWKNDIEEYTKNNNAEIKKKLSQIRVFE